MIRARLLACLVLVVSLSCAESTPGLAPPGLDGAAPRLFFPQGLAVSKDGANLYVANSNIDRAFSAGTLVRLPATLFDDAAANPKHLLATLPKSTLVAKTDAFAGMLALNPAGDALYLTSRDHSLLTRIALDAQGAFSCDESKALGCSYGAVDLSLEDMTDPFALAFADLIPPGGTAAEPYVLVSHLSPVSTGTGTTAKDAFVAVIPERVAAGFGEKPFSNGAFRVDIGTDTSDSLAFDASTRRLFVGGCYIRVDPQTVISCQADPDATESRTNPLRLLLPESGGDAQVARLSLGSLVGGGNTVALALSSDATRLYLALTIPSALATIDLPAPGEDGPPKLVGLVPLAHQPSRMLVLRRATGDLVVVTATTNDTVTVADPNAGFVLAQLDADAGIGKGPYDLASTPTATGDRVYVDLFNGCAVQALDVPADATQTAVTSTVGACP